MKIELQEVPVQEIVQYNWHSEECKGFTDDGEGGVYGMGGKLNIRPAYQREFIYKDKQRDAVIETVQKDFPLNTLYFVINTDGRYEVLDGQQRLISIGQYVASKFSINDMWFHNLTEDQRNQILEYKLMVYFCEGTDSEKLDWFRVINIAGEKLTEQELRNAIYSGPWVSSARSYFSKTSGPAYQIAANYLKGVAIRQDYLETVLKWINDGKVEAYMAEHQHDENAEELWNYFVKVVEWVESIFPKYRKEMKGVSWGPLYNKYKENEYDPAGVEEVVNALMLDEDVTKKAGIYSYIFTENEKDLNIRAFSDKDKREAYERQKGICTRCGKEFGIDEMQGDHITPWAKGGKTVSENCQMLCGTCNRTKSAI